MRRKVAVAAVLAAALVGVVGADSIIKAREAALPQAKIIVEDVDSVVVTASISASEQLPVIAATSM